MRKKDAENGNVFYNAENNEFHKTKEQNADIYNRGNNNACVCRKMLEQRKRKGGYR